MRNTAAGLIALLATVATTAAAQPTPAPQTGGVSATMIADGLVNPWAIAILPDGRMLVTEKPGRMRLVSPDGSKSEPIRGLPAIEARRQGGLLDVTLHPDFARNRLVYFSYTEPGPGGNSTAVARGKLSGDDRELTDLQVVFSQRPKLPGAMHYGSRIVFDGKGHVFVGLGERFDYREQAQDLGSHLGKVVRIREDGGVPADNPFVGRPGALPEIWSLGHRNIQAAAMHPDTGRLWVIEHGPRGGDEINIVEPGKNYGWPVVSYGVNYDGTRVGTGKAEAPGFEKPIHQWTPVIAPSGMMFYTGKAFPAWKGNLFVGGLNTRTLVRLELDGDRVVREERLIRDLGERIRDVAQGPDGAIYVVTDETNGKIIRIAPSGSAATGAAPTR